MKKNISLEENNMKNKKTLKRPLFSFILLSNIIFIIILAFTGIGLSLGASEIIIKFAQLIGSWSSTLALLILFKRIYPEVKFTDFIRKQFSKDIKILNLIWIIIIPILVFIASMIFIPNVSNIYEFSIYNIGTLGLWLLFNLLCGPLGEELGWRGFALNKLEMKYSPLTSALILGFFWGLWHFPLWLLSGYTGFLLLKYILFFMIAIMSFNIVITVFYNKNRNLLIPIILHLLFNFFTSNFNANIFDIYLYTAIFYTAIALILVLINHKWMLKINC